MGFLERAPCGGGSGCYEWMVQLVKRSTDIVKVHICYIYIYSANHGISFIRYLCRTY